MSSQFSVTLQDLGEKVEQYAKAHRISKSAVIRQALQAFFDMRNKVNQS